MKIITVCECPNCRKQAMEVVRDKDGRTVNAECVLCGSKTLQAQSFEDACEIADTI